MLAIFGSVWSDYFGYNSVYMTCKIKYFHNGKVLTSTLKVANMRDFYDNVRYKYHLLSVRFVSEGKRMSDNTVNPESEN